ncbi:MAG: hypothetical protein WDM89_08610 [Rhizomicrobium sp.]
MSVRPAVNVRAATKADSRPLSQSLARAFYDDPVFSHFLPDDAARLRKLETVMAILFKLGEPHGACYTTDNYESITLWRPPNEWDVPFWAYIVNGPALLTTFGGGIGRVLSTLDMMENIHPHEPHWYLQTIGTDPEIPGQRLWRRDHARPVGRGRRPAHALLSGIEQGQRTSRSIRVSVLS